MKICLTSFVIFILIFTGCKVNHRYTQPDFNNYKILKIDSLENLNIFYAKKNDSIFKIVTENVKLKNCIKIKPNYDYHLDLVSILPKNDFQKYHRYGSVVYGTLVKFDKDSTIVWDLFLTENIKGRCYLK